MTPSLPIRSIQKNFASFLLLSLLLPQLSLGQQNNATLRVLPVSKEDGISIAGATVLLTEPNADTLYAKVTDDQGFVEFSDIPAQTYQIHISFIGLQTTVETITLEPGLTRIYQPELAIDTAELGEVIVNAQRSGAVRREAGRQTITSEDLSRVPSAGPGGDLTAYLQTLPSVVTTGDRGGELHVRGGTPYQNLVMVENMPIIKPYHISNLFSAFPSEALSSVDMYAGGFGAQYSGATSAVLDVSLRQGSMRKHQGQFALSPYLLSLQIEGPIVTDRQSMFLMYRHSIIEQTSPDLIGKNVPIKFYDFTGRYSVNWDTMNCNITVLKTSDSGQINPARDVNLKWTNTVAGLRCLGFGEDLENVVDFTLGYTGFNNSELGIDNTGRTSKIDMGYMRLDNNQNLAGIPTDYGFKLDFIRYRAKLDELFADGTRKETRFIGLGSKMDVIFTNLTAYVSLNWQPNRKITIRPGITSQLTMRDLTPTIEPRLRISYRPNANDNQEFSLALGRYFQLHEAISDERDAGTVFGIYKPIDKGDPYPESLHAIAGYRQRVNRYLEFSLEGYAKRSLNIHVAQWTREPGNTLETGLADGKAYGADLQVELNIKPFFLSASYGLSEVIYEAPSKELVAWIDRDIFRYNPTHDRRHQMNVTSTLSVGKFTGNVNWQLSTGGTYTKIFAFDLAMLYIPRQHPLRDQGTAMTLYSEPFDGRFPTYQRVDVSLRRPFNLGSNLQIDTKLGVINAFDARNVFYFDVNTLQQVDQLPLIPYLAITTKIR